MNKEGRMNKFLSAVAMVCAIVFSISVQASDAQFAADSAVADILFARKGSVTNDNHSG